MTLAEVVVPTDPARTAVAAADPVFGWRRAAAWVPHTHVGEHCSPTADPPVTTLASPVTTLAASGLATAALYSRRSLLAGISGAGATLWSTKPPWRASQATATRRTTRHRRPRRDGPHKRPDATDHTKDPTRRTTQKTRRGGPHKRPDAAGQTLSGRDHVDQLGRTNDHVLDGTPGKRSLHAGSGKCQRPQLVGRDLR